MGARTIRLPGLDGVTLAADAYGDPSARPVMFAHGGGQTRHSWARTCASLAERGWYTVTVDLRGHGDSDWSPDGVYGLDKFAGDLHVASQSLGDEVAMVGASLGGLAAMVAVAEMSPSVATMLVLVDIAPKAEIDGVRRIGAFMRDGLGGFDTLEDVADAIAAYNPHRPRSKDLNGLKKNVRQRDDGRWYWHWDPKFMRPAEDVGNVERGYTQQVRLEQAARRITVPTLLIRGGSSDVVSEEGARHMLSLVPHAEWVDVAGAGHMVTGDRNDAFNDAVVSFLERTAGQIGAA